MLSSKIKKNKDSHVIKIAPQWSWSGSHLHGRVSILSFVCCCCCFLFFFFIVCVFFVILYHRKHSENSEIVRHIGEYAKLFKLIVLVVCWVQVKTESKPLKSTTIRLSLVNPTLIQKYQLYIV